MDEKTLVKMGAEILHVLIELLEDELMPKEKEKKNHGKRKRRNLPISNSRNNSSS